MNTFHAIRDNKASSDKGSLNVAGTIHLKKKDFVSVYVYSHSDKDWSVNSTSGFGCHRLGTNIGFHAANSKSQTFKTGWVTPTTWRTSVDTLTQSHTHAPTQRTPHISLLIESNAYV